MSDRRDARTVDQDLPAGWRRPSGSAWVVGAFRFPTRGDAASAGGAMATSLRALGLDGLSMRWAADLLLIRIEARPTLPAEVLAQALAGAARSVEGCSGQPVEPVLGGWGLPPLAVRDPRLAQASLHGVAAELLRIEAYLEELAAEAAAGAASVPPGGGSWALWAFLESIVAQLLADNFGPLLDDLRRAAVRQPAEEPRAAERAA